MSKKIGFVGAGKVGTSLASMLKSKKFQIVGFFSRSFSSAEKAADLTKSKAYANLLSLVDECDVVFITTPDAAIKEICDKIAGLNGFNFEHIIVHTSGAHSTVSLESAKEKGAAVLSLHPLQTIASLGSGIKNLPGSYFSAEGDERGMLFARDFVNCINGTLLEIPTQLKPLYHASACVVSNYFVSIVNLGVSMMGKLGIEKEDALLALLPLIKGTLNNIETIGVPNALTGPISRGDVLTIESQLKVMEESFKEVIPLYNQLGLYTVQVAQEKGDLNYKTIINLKKTLEVDLDERKNNDSNFKTEKS